ncbi:hypothetical protein [Paenibacillus illinoisensis]|uniref:Uncharacterized protein n=1 Tax=Paenibacillus illinoisensis TaxID=59845 RepID=A0A2W0CJA6_9BACL|nr:hypothetical protein [Paenibacillus illinoisensis]PYY28385.1 Uncharacterized protein PIL02S_03541 [Paenibacillus illinoisensis]
MAGAAYNGSTIQQSNKSGHVSYVERYQSGSTCSSWDINGNCTGYSPVYSTATHSTGARITGAVQPTSTVYVNGQPLGFVSSPTQEQWVADPPPSPQMGGTIISISPGTSGNGVGQVSSGSSGVFVGGKAIASIGGTVTTHLGTSTTITSGSSNVFVN